ncbi:UDP-N-acetylglucosamine 2-epimerase [Alicyclobacillus sp. ALC3]|uniref:UDP-N-acetylglucosamine 2-epimerase n=1 Tax=Alicyclobacillus sp. ALC3 TaxID=2796143 RepID=UPI00237A0024|nr:UDP-N-acetylglucosamine 2-epimerase [Alicyclobacillus sp. ALC3]WDL95137.1 UDP-N-acetylglucosamine 2-epimerase (hydrolyzing) [Alicyclobacillus sp. ALC3]
MSKFKVCVVTGSRSEYHLQKRVIRFLQADPDIELQVVATGMHLSPEFGQTVQEIEADGLPVTDQVEMLLSSDTSVGVIKSVGLGCIGFADTFSRLSPDVVMGLGDRFEWFAAAQAAFFSRIPIVHIAGGDVTQGAFDDAIRHSVTKMASLHLVTNALSRERVIQLGEDPALVYNVGHPGLDGLRDLNLLRGDELARQLGFAFQKRNLLVTYHPPTAGAADAVAEFQALLNALGRLEPDVGVVFTRPNADPGGRRLSQMVDDYVRGNSRAAVYTSLGQLLYFSLVNCVDAVVGNSSSGICEVPSLKKPTVDIGERQKGRMRGASVIHCNPLTDDLPAAIQRAWEMDCSNLVNPYGDGMSSPRIVTALKHHLTVGFVMSKRFFEVGK